jgi:hypothetical protein
MRLTTGINKCLWTQEELLDSRVEVVEQDLRVLSKEMNRHFKPLR